MNSCAGFVSTKYTKESDVISPKWLRFEERVAFLSCKFAFNFMILVNRITLVISLKLMSTIFLIKFLFFHQMIALKKLWKMFFISSKKLFLFLRLSNFCNFFPSFPNFPNSNNWMWNNLWCHELACINLQM